MVVASGGGAQATGPSSLPADPEVTLAGATDERLQLYTAMATWCAACKRELPQVRLLRDRFSGTDVGLYGVPVDVDDTDKELSSYVEEHEPAYELIRGVPPGDVERFRGVIRSSLGLDVLPASVVTDADGKVLHVQAGVPTVSVVRRLLVEADNAP